MLNVLIIFAKILAKISGIFQENFIPASLPPPPPKKETLEILYTALYKFYIFCWNFDNTIRNFEFRGR